MINVFTLYNEGTGSVIPQTDQHSATTGTERYKLMQFIGLKDKNGKEVYEGDLLQLSPELQEEYGSSIFEVKWHEKENGWNTVSPLGDYIVIGNIYENPELLIR